MANFFLPIIYVLTEKENEHLLYKKKKLTDFKNTKIWKQRGKIYFSDKIMSHIEDPRESTNKLR